ncbi:MAG TPA: GTP cyclohydrolase II, partial [Prolixibacteraceae bacterium]|nr:GTP cyclohydrolase II [Prolixibacteraceae bacterium]
MARLPELMLIAEKYNMKIVSIADLIAHLIEKESLIKRGEEAHLPTAYGNFKIIPFLQRSNGKEHVALMKGSWEPDEAILVRMHSSCITGDIFGSMRCECGDQLHKSMELIEKEGKGVIVYLDQEGRGIGLLNKIKAYKLQEEGLDTVDANVHLGFAPDERDYGVGAQILRELGVKKMRLLSNNPVKRVGLEGYGLKVVENIAIEVEPNEYNQFYMKTKRDRMGHTLQKFNYNKD